MGAFVILEYLALQLSTGERAASDACLLFSQIEDEGLLTFLRNISCRESQDIRGPRVLFSLRKGRRIVYVDCYNSRIAFNCKLEKEQTEWNIDLLKAALSRLASDHSLIKNSKIESMAKTSGSGDSEKELEDVVGILVENETSRLQNDTSDDIIVRADEIEPARDIATHSRIENHGYYETSSGNPPSSVALSVDDNDRDSDNDSALGDTSIYSTSTSVRSSVYQFVEENGRTYHRYREGKYYLPNDEKEQDRLDLQHHLFLMTLNGELYNAPIKNLPGGLHNVLDIATGTGIWAIEFATEFPSARVIGTDLSPIQPEFTPPNCHWEVDDAEDTWLYTHQFDYIHGRALATCFKSHIPVIASAFAFTRPGGYFELQDCIVPFRCIDNSMAGTNLERWGNLMMEGITRCGKDWTRVRNYKEYLEDAGFVDVVERKYEWPLGTWAKGKRNKQIGAWYREDMLSGLEGFSMAILTRAMKMSVEAVELLLVGVRDDIKSNKIHVYVPVRVVYGRKP